MDSWAGAGAGAGTGLGTTSGAIWLAGMSSCRAGLCVSCNETGFSPSEGGARFSWKKEVVAINNKDPKKKC